MAFALLRSTQHHCFALLRAASRCFALKHEAAQ
jgi:hypothetical protein